jgi:release factor glutamine methyltransferase
MKSGMAATRWQVIEDVADRLADAGVPSPQVDAQRIVEHVEDRFGGELSGCPAHVLDALVSRRAQREPLQHVVGRTWFRNVEVACRPGVFVPRPETEIVAGAAITAARAGTDRVVVDLCTGTGVVALAVASEVPDATVVAVDASVDAVALARDNVATVADAAPPRPWRPGGWLAPGSRVEVAHGDLFAPLDPARRGRVDVVVANPPYLPARDRSGWAPEVADHDPDAALVAGPDGFEVVRAILDDARVWLRDGGTVVMEIDERRGFDAQALATAAGYHDVRLVPDLTGRDRAVVATWSGSGGRRAMEGDTSRGLLSGRIERVDERRGWSGSGGRRAMEGETS